MSNLWGTQFNYFHLQDRLRHRYRLRIYRRRVGLACSAFAAKVPHPVKYVACVVLLASYLLFLSLALASSPPGW